MTVEKFNSGFSTLGLALPLLKMLERQGLTEPTTIQKQSIPIILRGEDVIGLSQTGTGKTAAFILPLLSNLYGLERTGKYRPVRSLILSPTREIVKQIDDVTRPFLSTVNLKSIALYGGVPILKQIRTLRRGSDIVIGTPGRIEDHISEGTLDISRVQSFVLDEADQMLDIGFLPAIERICKSIPAERQTLLFSATMSTKVKALAQSFLNNSKQIITSDQIKISNNIDQKVIFLKPEEKVAELQMILRRKMANRVLVFSRTKYAVDKLVKICTRIGFNLNAIHGDKSQAKREEALAYFKQGNSRILVATDIAARGLDLPNVDLIINFDLPTSAEIYIHRVGRTARAGKSGQVISFCSYHERESLRMIEKFIKQKLRVSSRLGKSIEDHSSSAIKSLRTRHGKKK